MTTTTRRALAAALTCITLAAPVALAQTAQAAPKGEHADKAGGKDKAPKAKKSQTKQLVKDITGKDSRLAAKAVAEKTVALADEHEAVVVENITADRAALAALKDEALAAESVLDTRATRKELRAFRVENYVLVVNVLHKAEGLVDAAAVDPEALVFVQSAIDKALATTATSPKSDLRAARHDLAAAQSELEAAGA